MTWVRWLDAGFLVALVSTLCWLAFLARTFDRE